MRGMLRPKSAKRKAVFACTLTSWPLLAAHRQTGLKLGLPSFLGLLAAAYGLARQPEAGLEAVTTAERICERWYAAELHWRKGELLLACSEAQELEVETCIHEALAIAHRQRAKPL
jgi:hypothetical protein